MTLRSLVLSLAVFSCACSAEDPAASPTTDDAGVADAVAEGNDAAVEACAPVSASSEPVSVDNDYGTLGGVLEIPDGCGAMPVVLVISGSGSNDRDGNVPGSAKRTDTYKLFAEAVREQAGAATLRYDDHGIGASVSAAPAIEDFRFETEVQDAARWIALLRSDPRFSRVVVAGHSQGSLTAILAAQEAPIDGFISLAGAGRPAGALLHEQLAPKLTPALLAELDAAIAKLEAGELAGPLSPPLDQILPVSAQPYFISWLAYDPKQEIATLTAPALLVQGTTDIQVSVMDAELLKEGKPDASLALIDDMCHPLKQATSSASDQQAAYSDPSVPLAAGLMPPVADFLHGVEAR